MPQSLQRRLEARVRRLGYLGEFFQVAALQPALLAAFVDFTEAGQAALPEDLYELVALTVATYTSNRYERHQHERRALQLGLEARWIRAVERVDPERASLSRPQRIVQRYVLAALAGYGQHARDALAELIESLGAAPAVAVVMVCGRYVAHALLVNSCGLEPPVQSIFGDEPVVLP